MGEHPNDALIRRGYEAFAAGDMDGLREFFADDIVWHSPGEGALAGDYKGQDDVFGMFGKLFELTGGTFKIEIHDILANDEHAIVLTHSTASRNGDTFDMNEVHVWHMRDRKATEFWNFDEDQRRADAFLS